MPDTTKAARRGALIEDRPLRIVYDLRPLQTASALRGIGTVTSSLLRALSRIDRVNEYRLLRWPDGPAPDPGLEAGFRWSWRAVPRCPLRKAGWLYDTLTLSRRLACEGDVAHFLSPFDLDLGWAPFIEGGRAIVFVHDLMPLHQGRLLRGRRRLLVPVFRWMARRLRKAWRVTCNSATTAEDLAASLGIGPERARVAALGVGEAFHPRAADEVDEAGRRLGIRRPYLLYVGGTNANKNLPLLLDALGQAPDVPLAVLAVSAPSGRDASLARAIAQRGVASRIALRWNLSTEDLARLYAGAHLVALPSLCEGFGLPLLEALRSGAPVACSDIPPYREVGQDSVAYFPPQDAAAATRVISELWNDAERRRLLRESGLARAADFTWEACARRVLEVYREARADARP